MERKLQSHAGEQVYSLKKLKCTHALAVINKSFRLISKLKVSACLLVVLLMASYGYSYGQTTFIKHYSTKDGLPSNSCYFTLQDRKGYIWVATDAGVCRFDGKVFEIFSIDDGLPDNQIVKLYEDSQGRIWFSALNGQLSYYSGGKIFNDKNEKSLKLLNFNSVVVSFFEDSKKNMWFGTNRNLLAKWDGKSLKKYVSANPASQFINTTMYEDVNGKIWANSTDCLHSFNGRTVVREKNTMLPLSFKTVQYLAGQTLLFLDKRGLNLRKGGYQQLLLKVDSNLLKNNPGYFYGEKRGELWLSNNAGVFHIDSIGNQNRYLPGIMTSQVIRDSRQNMWFTTNNGIYMLPEKSKRLYVVDHDHGLSNNGIKSLIKDKRNRFWLGMDNGTINIISKPGYKVTRIALPDKNKFNMIKQLALDSSGNTVFFSSDYGLGKMDISGEWTTAPVYLQEANNFSFVLKNFSISSHNELALAMSSGIVIVKNPMQNLSFSSSAYKEGENFFSGRAYRVFYDSHQNLWFSNTRGYSRFSNGKVNQLHLKDSLLKRRVNDVAQLPDGTTVLATDGYGLLFYRNDKMIRQITRDDGLANNICKKIFVQQDYLWVVTSAAVNRIYLRGNFSVESFDFTNSTLDNDVNAIYADKDTAYFATNHGLVFFANRQFDRTQEVPKVLISSILINKKQLGLDAEDINLEPAENNITFHYSAIDFQNNSILYRYRLKPSDAWTETRSRRLEFSSMDPGDYIFELSARTRNSQWSKPVTVVFTLREHFWQSTWFGIMLLVMAALSFYKIAVSVTRQQRDKEQQKLLLKNKILMLEQQALQAMMNPHFVFNVMNSIQHYINTKNTSSANKILTGFARLIRKNLDICTKSFISLEEEIDYLTLYLRLEKMRFGDKFNYTIQIEDDIDMDETTIPSMILQPYIENAIWHGLMPKDEGGNLAVVIRHHSEDALLIQITDDGIGIDNAMKGKTEKHNSKGMSLTQERVNLINQIEADPIQITISQNGLSGTTISILIPNR